MTFPPAAAVDGYVQALPPTKLTLTELHREVRRCTRARHTMPLGPSRDAVIERQWAIHQERACRMTLLALRAGLQLA